MKLRFHHIIIFLLVLSACETMYLADTDKIENVISIDARLIADGVLNTIEIKKSLGFNEPGKYIPVTAANVRISNDLQQEFLCVETESGNYTIDFPIVKGQKYKLLIDAGGDTYESDYTEVPDVSGIDSLYSAEMEKVVRKGGSNDVNDFSKLLGHQYYVNMENEGEVEYYRFFARKILQYFFPFDTIIDGEPRTEFKFGWKSIYPGGSFNLAGPAVYSSSTDIIKHPVDFFPYVEEAFLDSIERGWGWIYIIREYGLTKSAFNYYKDLNNQLDADGKIFDPMYVQARSNLKCTSDSKKIVLGNFEIATYREYRYYLRLESDLDKQILRESDDVYISEWGIKSLEPPYFWEY